MIDFRMDGQGTDMTRGDIVQRLTNESGQIQLIIHQHYQNISVNYLKFNVLFLDDLAPNLWRNEERCAGNIWSSPHEGLSLESLLCI